MTRHILRMTPPMVGAFFAMQVFHLADTWFVSRLGTLPLAAMGFTFPILMLIYSTNMGLGIGISARVSQALGAGDHHRVQHLATYGLLLGLLVMLVICALLFGFVHFFLDLVGAKGEAEKLASDYLLVLLPFVPFSLLPMIGNHAIRATGDTLRPSLIMASGAVLNIAIDPVLIFGWGPVPALGIRGAALATGLSRLVTLGLCLYWMQNRFRLLKWGWDGWRFVLTAWGQVLHLAVPAAATNVLTPLTFACLTRIIAPFGEEAVAATAAGQRIEHFVWMGPIALGSVLAPIIGQNWGARRLDRVYAAWCKAGIFGVSYGLVAAFLAWPLGRPVAACFSSDPRVVSLTTYYLRVLLLGASLLHLSVQTGYSFNAVQSPLRAAAVTVSRLLVFILPLAWLGSRLGEIHGIYLGFSAGRLLSGATAGWWFWRFLRNRRPEPACSNPSGAPPAAASLPRQEKHEGPG